MNQLPYISSFHHAQLSKGTAYLHKITCTVDALPTSATSSHDAPELVFYEGLDKSGILPQTLS
jgi:hypothetical protein